MASKSPLNDRLMQAKKPVYTHKKIVKNLENIFKKTKAPRICAPYIGKRFL
jgi:hypothetical protein